MTQAHVHLPTRAHDARAHDKRRLALVLALSALYLFAELAGGLLTGSLALLADAGHMFADVGALALALFAFWLADRPASAARTFGWRRFEILAALANGLVLAVVALGVAFEAAERLRDPRPVLGLPAFAIASGGLVVNLVGYIQSPPDFTAEQKFHLHPKELSLQSDGPFGTFDRQQLQRGFQVYKEVCAACHGLNLVAFRDLHQLGYNEAEVKAIAN